MRKLIMYSLYSLFTFHFSLSTLKAQGTWTPRDTLPDTAMCQGIPGFSIGNFGYAGLGNDEYDFAKLSDKLWRFDPSTNSWAQMASFPGSARVAPANFVIGNKAYLVTGSVKSNGTCVTECWEYNSITNTWIQKANFPGSPRTYATAFAIGGKGYVGTGANEYIDFRKDFYAYDTATNTWARIADFGGIARDGDCGFAVNGKGYVCFGQDSTFKGYKDIWEYDTGSNTWTQKSDAFYPLVEPEGFVICNNIYVGSADSTHYWGGGYNEFWKYNTVLATWSPENSVPGAKKFTGVAFAIADSGYYGFGEDSAGPILNVFDKFYGGDSCSNITTGYNAITEHSEINIHPNPNSGIFTVAFISDLPIGGEESPLIIEVYNLLGENVLTETLHNTQGNNSINMRNQPSAVYLYRVTNQNGNLLYSGKFIIQ